MKRCLVPLFVLCASLASAAMSVTWTSTVANPTGQGALVMKHQAVVVSAADGSASGTLAMSGKLVQMVSVPDGGGTAPTNLYDCTLKDPNGADIATGLLANLSSTVTAVQVPLVGTLPYPFRIYGTATLACAAMGDTKGATLAFYVEE